MKTQTEKTKKPMSKGRKIVNVIATVVLVIVLIFFVVCSFTAFIAKRGSGVPNFFGVEFFVVQSDSMSPTFEKGDLVVDFAVKDYSKLEKGDVITFWTIINGERALNTHRINEVPTQNADGAYVFITKGDNPLANEDSIPVNQKEIVGVYKTHVPKFGTFIEFMQTTTGFLLIVVLPIGLWFIWQLITFFRSLFAYQAEKVRVQYQQSMEEKKSEKSDDTDDKKDGE